MLLPTQKPSLQRGRPVGATTFDPRLAQAFSGAVRARRMMYGIAQETLVNLAGIERTYGVTTDSVHSLPVAPNLLERSFEQTRTSLCRTYRY